MRDRPFEAHFNFIEMLEGGEAAQLHRDRYVNRVVDLIDEGRGRLEDPDSASRDLVAALFGSIYLFLQSKLLAAAPDLAPPEPPCHRKETET